MARFIRCPTTSARISNLSRGCQVIPTWSWQERTYRPPISRAWSHGSGPIRQGDRRDGRTRFGAARQRDLLSGRHKDPLPVRCRIVRAPPRLCGTSWPEHIDLTFDQASRLCRIVRNGGVKAYAVTSKQAAGCGARHTHGRRGRCAGCVYFDLVWIVGAERHPARSNSQAHGRRNGRRLSTRRYASG